MISSDLLKETIGVWIATTVHHPSLGFPWMNIILNPLFGNMLYGEIEPWPEHAMPIAA